MLIAIKNIKSQIPLNSWFQTQDSWLGSAKPTTVLRCSPESVRYFEIVSVSVTVPNRVVA